MIHRALINGVVVWEQTADTYQGMGFFPREYIEPTEDVVTLEIEDGDGWQTIGIQTP